MTTKTISKYIAAGYARREIERGLLLVELWRRLDKRDFESEVGDVQGKRANFDAGSGRGQRVASSFT